MSSETLTIRSNGALGGAECAILPQFDSKGSPKLWLNDDCLVEIFKQLDTSELIALSKLCEHCLYLVKTRIFGQRAINIDELAGGHDIEQMLLCFGSHISYLTINRWYIQRVIVEKADSAEILEILVNRCGVDVLKRLNITLNLNEIGSKHIASFSVHLRNLLELKVTAINYSSSRQNRPKHEFSVKNNDQIETLLQNSICLKSMNLNAMQISGTFLSRSSLKHLTELEFQQCNEIEASALIQSGAQLKCLKNFTWKNSKFAGILGTSDTIQTLCNILGREFASLTQVSVHMNYHLKYCHYGQEPILSGLRRLSCLQSLSLGIGGACACNNFYASIQQLNLNALAIESPMVFGGRVCLPCTKVISNYLPNIFSHLSHLTKLRIVHVNSDNECLLNEIINRLPDLEHLHLIGYRKMNAENLLSLIKSINGLKMLNIDETRFEFTSKLYEQLVGVCYHLKRSLRIFVSQGMKRALFNQLQNCYRKEYVEIVC